MIRNPKLSKTLADSNWDEFVYQLQYKAKWPEHSLAGIDHFTLHQNAVTVVDIHYLN